MCDIRYLNTWEMVFQVAYFTDDLCIIIFFVLYLAVFSACPTIIWYTILNCFQAFLCLFQFHIFFVFQVAIHPFILLDPSSVLFSWLGTFGSSDTGSPVILLSAFPQQFHSSTQFHKCLQYRITYYFKIKILVTLFWWKSFSHFIPTDRIYSCHMEPWHKILTHHSVYELWKKSRKNCVWQIILGFQFSLPSV